MTSSVFIPTEKITNMYMFLTENSYNIAVLDFSPEDGYLLAETCREFF